MADIKFNCPHCEQSLEAPEDMLADVVDCPSCNTRIQIPRPQQRTAPTGGKGTLPQTAGQVQGTPRSNKRNEAHITTKHEGGPRPIGGWLLLPAIGFCLAPVCIVQRLWVDYKNMHNQFMNGWGILPPREGMTDQTWVIWLWLVDMIGMMVCGVVIILLIRAFFGRKKEAPKLFIGYALFLAAHGLLLCVILPFVGRFQEDVILWVIANIVSIVGVICVWIPYFLSSKRVRETFVI
jgi:hypothetical protein